MDNPGLAVLQNLYDTEIPLAHSMQLKVLDYERGSLRVQAPLQFNKNHHGTAFGGSLYCAMLLAGWGRVYLLLQEAGLTADIVVSGAEVKYRLPVTSDFTAETDPLEPTEVTGFVDKIRNHGNGRIAIKSVVRLRNREAASLQAQYAVY